MQTATYRQLGAVSYVRPMLRAGIVGGGVIMIIGHRRKLP